MIEPADSIVAAPPGNWAATHLAPALDLLAGPDSLLWLPLVRVYPQGVYVLVQLIGRFTRRDQWAARTSGVELVVELADVACRFNLAADGVQTHELAGHQCVLWNQDRGNHGATWGLWCSPLPAAGLAVGATSSHPHLGAQGQLRLSGDQLRGQASQARQIAATGPASGLEFLGR